MVFLVLQHFHIYRRGGWSHNLPLKIFFLALWVVVVDISQFPVPGSFSPRTLNAIPKWARIEGTGVGTHHGFLMLQHGFGIFQAFSLPQKIHATQNPQIHANFGNFLSSDFSGCSTLRHCFGCQSFRGNQPRILSWPFLFWKVLATSTQRVSIDLDFPRKIHARSTMCSRSPELRGYTSYVRDSPLTGQLNTARRQTCQFPAKFLRSPQQKLPRSFLNFACWLQQLRTNQKPGNHPRKKKRTRPPPKEHLWDNFPAETREPYPSPNISLCGHHVFQQRKVPHWSGVAYGFFFPATPILNQTLSERKSHSLSDSRNSRVFSEHLSELH